ncbi:MAG: hypothetical protein KDA58_03935 [Planctomycetaceae bacterium]|nr:hypothetical protein [Planctomycetaceae bacterium]
MRHVWLMLLLYAAMVAQLAQLRPVVGVPVWWLDLVLLVALRWTVRPGGIVWCALIGLASDLCGASPPGLGLFLGATAGMLLLPQPEITRTTLPDRIGPAPVAMLLMLFHVVPALLQSQPASVLTESWTASLLTLGLAALWQLTASLRERGRERELMSVSRQEW